jgi:hypothetical protein
MTFHTARDSLFGLFLRLLEKVSIEEHPEEKDQQDDHDRGADEFSQGDLPTQQHEHDNAEFEDEIGGGHFEGHRGGEVRAFAEDRAGQSHGRVRAR